MLKLLKEPSEDPKHMLGYTDEKLIEILPSKF